MRKGVPSNKAAFDWAVRDAWSNCGLKPTAPVRPYKVTLPAKQPPPKDSPCPVPSGAEGQQEVWAVITDGPNTVSSVRVQLTGSDAPQSTVSDKRGVAHFVLAQPGVVTLLALPAGQKPKTMEGIGESGWIFLPTTRVVRVLPGCSHTVEIDLTLFRPANAE